MCVEALEARQFSRSIILIRIFCAAHTAASNWPRQEICLRCSNRLAAMNFKFGAACSKSWPRWHKTRCSLSVGAPELLLHTLAGCVCSQRAPTLKTLLAWRRVKMIYGQLGTCDKIIIPCMQLVDITVSPYSLSSTARVIYFSQRHPPPELIKIHKEYRFCGHWEYTHTLFCMRRVVGWLGRGTWSPLAPFFLSLQPQSNKFCAGPFSAFIYSVRLQFIYTLVDGW